MPTIVIDIITTAQGAKRLLEYRVSKINETKEYINYIICPENPLFTNSFRQNAIPYIPLRMYREIDLIHTIIEIKRFYDIIKNIRPQIVHAHTSKAGAVARVACCFYNLIHKDKIYICYQVHSFYFNALTGIKSFIFLKIEILLAWISDIIFFQNEIEKEQAQKYRMDRNAILENIGNGINFQEFSYNFTIRTLPDWINYKPFTIICIARVEPKKNHTMLIESINILRVLIEKKYGYEICKRAFKVYCVGEIGYSDPITLTKELNLEQWIQFSGIKNRREIEDLLITGDLSVLTSYAEGKPRALMESMYAGLPCIATKVVGSSDVIDDRKTGFLVPLHDSECFAKSIFKLMEDGDLYKSFSKASKEKAEIEFDENRVIEYIPKNQKNIKRLIFLTNFS